MKKAPIRFADARRGLSHTRCEDFVLAEEGPSGESILCLADGVTTARRGGEAARGAVRAAVRAARALLESRKASSGAQGSPCPSRNEIRDTIITPVINALREASGRVRDGSFRHDYACTLLLAVTGREGFFCHVGDGVILSVQAGKPVLLSGGLSFDDGRIVPVSMLDDPACRGAFLTGPVPPDASVVLSSDGLGTLLAPGRKLSPFAEELVTASVFSALAHQEGLLDGVLTDFLDTAKSTSWDDISLAVSASPGDAASLYAASAGIRAGFFRTSDPPANGAPFRLAKSVRKRNAAILTLLAAEEGLTPSALRRAAHIRYPRTLLHRYASHGLIHEEQAGRFYFGGR